ncbi:hypothetical protein ACF0H5_002552 [Mactra antiquata]
MDIDIQDLSLEDDTEVIDSSSEYDTELEDEIVIENDNEKQDMDDEKNNDAGCKTYKVVCEKLNIVPIRRLVDQLPLATMRLQHIGMNTGQCKALSCALWHNTCLNAIELKDNGLTGEEIDLIINVIKYHEIYKLGFPDNCVGEIGAIAIDEMIRVTTSLTHLNLSGCKIGDTEVDYISSGLYYNNTLVWLDLSNNNIASDGGKKLGGSLGETRSLQSLNMSWNHIRMDGAVGLLKGLQINESLIYLDLSMNGLGYEGCLALECTLRENKCLKYLDVSNDRINWEGITFVARGLKKNSTLEILKIGHNPLNMEGCYDVLKAVSHGSSNIKHVGFDNIPVNGAVLTVASDILKTRPFSITHGGVLDTRDVVGIRKEKPEDPISLVVRYITNIGIRMIDMYRILDIDNDGHVSKTEFIKGMKKIGIPLSDRELRDVARRLDHNRTGFISYSLLNQGVKNHVREERKEDKRQEVKKRTKLQERRRILETELPVLYKRDCADDLIQFYASESLSNIPSQAKSAEDNDELSTSNNLFLPEITSTHSFLSQTSQSNSVTKHDRAPSSVSERSVKVHSPSQARKRFRKPLEMLRIINIFMERKRSLTACQSRRSSTTP